MYSLVLMAALSSGSATPDCFHLGHHGGYSCCGCWGGGCYGGCYGCWGGSCYGCWGCYGATACYGCYGVAAYAPTYGPSYGAPAGVPGDDRAVPMKKSEPAKEVTYSGRARLMVELPADAKLFIDDRPMRTQSERRTFTTPALEPGQLYYYVLRAEVTRDGKTVADTRRVIIKAGETVRASFQGLGQDAGVTTAFRR